MHSPQHPTRPSWLKIDQDPTGNYKYIVSRLPPEFENKPCEFGMGMFAKKDYTEGDLMWIDYYFLVENEPGKILVRFVSKEGEVVESCEQDVIVHCIQRHATNQREVYFDCYCNSSCNPNLQIVSLGDFEDGSGGAFATVAARDIKKGDQLHNCYDLLEWDCQDKGVDCCACGFEGCRGKAWGYKFLSEDVQEKLKPKLSITVLMQMKKLGKINEDEFDSILAQGRATVKASVK